jgi:hypothetical protein
VRIYSQDMAVCSLVCIVTAISVTQQCSRAATVRSEPSVRRRSSADPPRCCLRTHCCSARLGTPVADHHPHARGAVMGLHAVCLCAEHSDAPPSDQAGLPWCQPTCPVCQWQAILLTWTRPAHLPTFNAVVGLESREGPSATGTWQGQPRSCREGGTWRHRTPSRGGGGSGPPRPVGAVRPVEVWAPARGGSGPPWGVRVRGGHPRAPLPSWARGSPGPIRARGRSGDHDPGCQARAVCHITQRASRRLRITYHPS